MATYEPEVKATETIVVPEKIIYPSLRRTFDSGLLKQGDEIIINITVKDKDGNIKVPMSTDSVVLSQYPENGYEVLGVGTLSFNESPIPNQVIAE